MKNFKFISLIKPSASHSLNHWIQQRLTATILIFLTIWLTKFIIVNYNLLLSDYKLYLSNPKHYVFLSLFIIIGLYHSMLGIQVILEDYVSNEHNRSIIINIFKYLTIITIVVSIVALTFFIIK